MGKGTRTALVILTAFIKIDLHLLFVIHVQSKLHRGQKRWLLAEKNIEMQIL